MTNETSRPDNRLLFFLSGRKTSPLRHLLVLLVLWWVVGASEYREQYRPLVKTIIVLILAGFAYCNMYWLVPGFLFRKKNWQYIAGCILLMTCSFWLQYGIVLMLRGLMLEGKKIESTTLSDIAAYVVVFGLLIIASTGIRLFQQWMNDTVRIGHLENARLQIELKHLKSQVNPHFLLNMLNNTDILIRREPDRASDVIHKLSGLLRYQLYDASHESVLLRDEIDFLKNYLFLEQTRRDHLRVSISQNNTGEDIFIQPLLFITFVENAVKHNTDFPGAFIDVDLHFQKVTGQLVIPLQTDRKGLTPVLSFQ